MAKSRSLALYRKSEAVRHFRNGCTFEQIAKKVGYASRGTAHKVVTAALEERIVEDIDDYRRMEVDRLDALQCELWEVAFGDALVSQRLRAFRLILQTIQLRAKILGLDAVAPEQPRMLVDPRAGNAGKATSGRSATAELSGTRHRRDDPGSGNPCSCRCHSGAARGLEPA